MMSARAQFIIEEFFECPGYNFPECSEELKREVSQLIEPLEIVYREILIEDNDTRSGEEIYGVKDNDRWNIDLSYISDRWYCAIRTRWMLDLAKHFKEEL